MNNDGAVTPADEALAHEATDPDLETPAKRIDVAELGELLLGRWAEERRRSRTLIRTDPRVWREPELSREEHRRRVFSQLHILEKQGEVKLPFPKHLGGQDNHGGNLAAFEELVLADPSLQIKAGVHWGLFGSAIMHLGTEWHHNKWLPDAMTLKVPGVFAMTERGHGSDVSSIGTTATYDPDTYEWVINTPFEAAWKDYLGNAAQDGRAAVVFAQLITKGVNHGVHAFYVPLRTPEGALLPGISAEDDGLKGGLNGIDNGRLCFREVRVPRENLLNRYGDVSENGTYTSPIESPGRRFFTMLGTLVQGRVSLDGAAVVAAKAALTGAITYANERRQFEGASGEETLLLDYQLHQRRLLPLLAKTYAMSFAHEVLLEQFDGVFSGAADTPEKREDLETLAAALKSLSTWHALETLQECREACGGAGFMAENRLVQLRADLDVYATFEGDNNVLLQLVGKRLLGDYAKQFKGKAPVDLALAFAGTTAERVFSGFGLRRLGQVVADLGKHSRSAVWWRDPDTQRELLAGRVSQMIGDIGMRLSRTRDMSPLDQAKVFNRNQYELIQAAKAHGELLHWDAFTEALGRIEDPETKRVLTWLRDLFALTTIEENLAWYVVRGKVSSQRALVLPEYVKRLLERLRPAAGELVEAFGFTPEQLRMPIASGVEARRQEEAREYYRELRESGKAPRKERSRRTSKKTES